jgi:hypothetical protein
MVKTRVVCHLTRLSLCREDGGTRRVQEQFGNILIAADLMVSLPCQVRRQVYPTINNVNYISGKLHNNTMTMELGYS